MFFCANYSAPNLILPFDLPKSARDWKLFGTAQISKQIETKKNCNVAFLTSAKISSKYEIFFYQNRRKSKKIRSENSIFVYKSIGTNLEQKIGENCALHFDFLLGQKVFKGLKNQSKIDFY